MIVFFRSLAILVLFFGQVGQIFGSPNPDDVTIRRITYSGSGCADATRVGASLASDAKSFTLIFDEYIAEVGPDIGNGHGHKNCKITLDLRFPSGYSYAISDFTYRGWVELERGVNASQKSSYYFRNNSSEKAVFRSDYRGPIDQDYTFTDSIPMEDFVWSRCGRVNPLVLETSLSLDNSQDPNAFGLIGVDSIDGAVRTIYRYRIYWSESICS